jgi:tetratricopeptide (TPR) repeat protein
MDPISSKAYYRSGQALIRLGRLAEALDCCVRCLSYDPTNEIMKALQDKTMKSKDEADEKEREKQEQKRKEERAKLALQMAYRVGLFPCEGKTAHR